jgi:hypothetical protein
MDNKDILIFLLFSSPNRSPILKKKIKFANPGLGLYFVKKSFFTPFKLKFFRIKLLKKIFRILFFHIMFGFYSIVAYIYNINKLFFYVAFKVFFILLFIFDVHVYFFTI